MGKEQKRAMHQMAPRRGSYLSAVKRGAILARAAEARASARSPERFGVTAERWRASCLPRKSRPC